MAGISIRKSFLLLIFIYLTLILSFSHSQAELNKEADTVSFSIEVSEENTPFVWRLSDTNRDSRIEFQPGDKCTIYCSGIAGLLFEWYKIPEEVNIRQYDHNGVQISEEKCSELFENLIVLQDDCFTVDVFSPQTFSISEINVLSKDDVNAYIPLTIPEKADVLAILAHTGDETVYLPGLIPYSSGLNCRTSLLVFASAKNRQQIKETLDSIRITGESSQPVFLSYRYFFLEPKFERFKAKIWDKKSLQKDIVENIRKYKPEIIITNSSEGEDEDMMRSFLSDMVQDSFDKVSKKNQYSDSYELFGIWEPKKLYEHAIESDNESTCIDVNIEEAALNNCSCISLSKQSLHNYRTLAVFHYSIDNTALSLKLVKSSIGPDTLKNDLFENVDPNLLSIKEGNKFLSNFEHAEKDEQDQSSSQDFESHADPVQENETNHTEEIQTVHFENESDDKQLNSTYITVAAIFLATVGGLLLLFAIIKKKWPLFIIALIPLICLTAICLYTEKREVSSQTSINVSDSVEVPKPSSSPVPQPSANEDELHIDNESNDDIQKQQVSYFAAEGDGESVISNEQKGYWEYKSESLSVIISRNSMEDSSGNPVVYYVADIRMNGDNEYRSGFGYFNEAGSAKSRPYEIARKYKAVLAITGDNLVNAEEKNKGVLIRNGILYSEGRKKVETMAINEDLTITLYPSDTEAKTIIEDGVQASYGFGPVLVSDGVCDSTLVKHRLNRVNPRCGIGMVEPGHFVAIVVDGRQPKYSVGISLVQFAELFKSNGCSVAYNMDGGVSAGMVFMGEHINRHRSSGAGRVSSQRPWPDALMFGYSDLVPSLTDPIINTGNGNEADRNRRKMADKASAQD